MPEETYSPKNPIGTVSAGLSFDNKITLSWTMRFSVLINTWEPSNKMFPSTFKSPEI